jgi:hypothetical protein
MSAWVPDMFLDFYLAKKHKIVNNSTTTKAIDKIDVGLAKFESN